MRSWPMLMQRGSTWYFRRIVPLALRPMMEGKREILRSLRTSDFNEAKLLSLREGQEVERLFQSLRKQSERAQVDPEAFARPYESRRRSADAEWRLRRDIAFRGEDDGSFESARRQSETLVCLRGVFSAPLDHKRLKITARPCDGAYGTVGNLVDSRPDGWRARSNHASILLGGRWLLSCSSGRMDHTELRARIRQLMASGDLPAPLGDKLHPGQAVRVTRTVLFGRSKLEPCLICCEADPMIFYTYANRRVVRLHAACDALWHQEREARS